MDLQPQEKGEHKTLQQMKLETLKHQAEVQQLTSQLQAEKFDRQVQVQELQMKIDELQESLNNNLQNDAGELQRQVAFLQEANVQLPSRVEQQAQEFALQMHQKDADMSAMKADLDTVTLDRDAFKNLIVSNWDAFKDPRVSGGVPGTP